MDALRAFYASGGKHIKIKGGETSGLQAATDLIDNCTRREGHRKTPFLSGTDYAVEIKERELEEMKRIQASGGLNTWDNLSIPGGLESMERLTMSSSTLTASHANIAELTEEAMTEVYSKYSFKVKEESTKLAIHDYKDDIIARIRSQQVVIIEGPTGCGKTTQVPQWIIDDSYQRRRHCKIIVTQPRRIAAISIAKRVAQERGWDVGGVVGYQVGLENRTTNDTRIHYVTTGVLLQKLVGSKNLNEFTHIILDEVHERGQEMDFLLLVIKKLLFSSPPGVKVILMSATFNVQAFASYFAVPSPLGFDKATWVEVRKKNMFAVKTFYLNHLDKFGAILDRAMPKDGVPFIQPDMYKLVIKLICVFEYLDQQEDKYSDASEADIPSVLVFLPGINEIEELYGYLNNAEMRKELYGKGSENYKWWVLPLHSTITADEQVKVFQRAPPGNRKIILSTNIAESSITVPDIKYVVDFCLMKVLVANEQTNFTSLQMKWASKTNCEQRSGRAGRVRDGRVYRLVTDKFYESLPRECPPEIQRCPLERLVLLAKMLEMGPPKDILALAMDPPDMSNIHRTILVLKEIGALKKTLEGEMVPLDGDITYIGRIMAKLPLDVHASKMILMGHIFGCLKETVVMAAAMTVKDVFSSPFRERLNAYNSKLTWADGSTSDCLAFLNVYKVWQLLRKQQHFGKQGHSEYEWARRFYVQIRALKELDDLVRELELRLSREGIECLKGNMPWSQQELPLLLKVLIAGAFYPYYFVQTAGDEIREREAVKTLGGNDPRTTVYLKDFPGNQPGSVYAASIKKVVQELTGDEPRVTFDGNSFKVYLTFDDDNQNTRRTQGNKGNPSIPGRVVLPVYKAIKTRQLQMGIKIALLPPQKANEMAAALEASKNDVNKDVLVPRLPEIDDTHIPIRISQFVNCGRFWAQYDDESTASDLRTIQSTLNKRPLLAYTDNITPGVLVAAPYQDEGGVSMYRAQVRKVLPDNMVWVFYIDYGSFGRVSTCSLRNIPSGICEEIPPLAMDCSLAEVAPSTFMDDHDQWSPQATRRFDELRHMGRLLAKVYSVSHGVVAIELLAANGKISVNKDLIDKGLARSADESYESKINHDLREVANDMGLAQKRAFNKQQTDSAFLELREVAPVRAKDCVRDVHLKGPFSPLESSVHSLMYGSGGKKVSIEWHSVNSVLLDTEPQSLYQRMLVAGIVGTDEQGGRLSLRHTTLLPNIPGLPAVISLLFCPNAELRRDEAKTRYVSALCGLGASADGAPLFPEHDLLVDIDVDLTVDDISLINHIRHLMDYTVWRAGSADGPRDDDETRAKIPKLIKEALMKLLKKRRKHREPTMVPKAWEWGIIPEEDLLEMEMVDPSLLERTVVHPLHTLPEIRPLSREELRVLKEENEALIAKVMRTPLCSSAEVQCKLCGTEVMATQAMRIHLYSRAHQEKEEDFRVFNS